MSDTQERVAVVWTLHADGTADCEEHGAFQHHRGGPHGCPACLATHRHAEEPD